jgi:hypothetical protein
VPTRILEAESASRIWEVSGSASAVSPGPIGLPRSARAPSLSADLLTPRTRSTWPRYLVGRAL